MTRPMPTARRPPSEPELSARLVRPFWRLLRERGAPIEALHVEGASLEDPDTRIPHRLAIALLELSAAGMGDPHLGLHAAERLEPGDLDVLEYVALSSRTVGEAIAATNRYLRLVHDAADFTLDTDGTTALWRYRLPADLPLPPMAVDYFMAVLSLLGRKYTGLEELPGASIHFAHPRPADVREHERIFRGPLRFAQPENALVLPESALELPMVKADAALKTLLERTASEILQRLPKTDTLIAHVRKLLAEELRGGDPGIARLARRLHTTPRTLRRRLDEAGVTHREILDQLRRDLAHQYLRQEAIAISEVAFLLGYSDASPFHKAFKRWSGVSPAEYRRQQRRSNR